MIYTNLLDLVGNTPIVQIKFENEESHKEWEKYK